MLARNMGIEYGMKIRTNVFACDPLTFYNSLFANHAATQAYQHESHYVDEPC